MNLFLPAAVCSLIISCNNGKDTANQAEGNVSSVSTSDNGSLKEDYEKSNSKKIDNISYKLFHLSENSLKVLFKEDTKEYNNFSCFYFDIQIDNESDILNYPSINYTNNSEKVQYLSFMMKDFISIKADNNLYTCLNSTYERTYGNTPSTRFFLVFNKINESDITFQYKDNYFGNGEIYLKLEI